MNILRPYQQGASDAVFEAWQDYASALVVCPTGVGKTQIFCDVTRRIMEDCVNHAGKKVIILVHREELATQASKRLQSFGLSCGIEMANQKCSPNPKKQPRIIVSTIQSLISGMNGEGRMYKFRPSDFSAVIVDECHHATAKSWTKVIDFFRINKDLKVLGVTATPDRADEMALGQIFETVAFEYEIIDAISDGWLVPIEQRIIRVDGLDFSHVKTTAGDLNAKELGDIMDMEENLHGVVSPSIEIIGNKRAIVFAVTVKQAELYAEIFNRHREGMADWVCGKTPKMDRAEKLSLFNEGHIQVMINVGVLTEGFDSPGVEVIIQARPTKSRSLYCQMVGRSTRPLPGVVDPHPLAEHRRHAIATSAKKSCLVIDFVGNSGRHKLMTTADILGGNTNEEALERAIKRAKDSNEAVDMKELVEEEVERIRLEMEEKRKLEAARRARLIGKAQYTSRSINPFDVFQLVAAEERGWDKNKKLSQKQIDFLLKCGIDPSSMSYAQGKQMVDHIHYRFKNKLCTMKQCSLLQKHGYDTKTLKMSEATVLIDALAKNGWKRPAPAAATGIPSTPTYSSPEMNIPTTGNAALDAFEAQCREARESQSRFNL